MRRIFSGRNARHRGEHGFAWRFILAVALLHAVLLLPVWPDGVRLQAFQHVPVEMPVLILLFAWPMGWAHAWVRGILVALLSVFAVLKVANLVTFSVYARPFNVLVDPELVPVAIDTLAQTHIMFAVGAVAGAGLFIVLLILSLRWIARVIATPARRGVSLTVGAVLGVVAAGLWYAPVLLPEQESLHKIARADAALFAADQVVKVRQSLEAAAAFERAVATDPFHDFPADRLLTKLRGKDVLLIFVEAYGRATQDPSATAPVAQIMQSEADLLAAGYAMKSAWLTSPTFGGASWLAHGTFLSGLWIDDHQRYNALFVSERQTLISDFKRAGWRATTVMPLFSKPWPEGAFFGYDSIHTTYTTNTFDYAGPSFGYATPPDQYTLAFLKRRELDVLNRPPVMAEVALASSHMPWVPRPMTVPWEDVGDGSIYAQARDGTIADVDWRSATIMRGHYLKAITYALNAAFSFAATQVTQPALIIILGDHQPIPMAGSTTDSHEVPVHILSRDPADLVPFAGWTDGLRLDAQSPIWKMDVMREHILKAYSAGTSTEVAPP